MSRDRNVFVFNNQYTGGLYHHSKTIAASDSSSFFSIDNTSGAQAFSANFTCNVGGYSVAKVYNVVHQYGTAPVYNLAADTGYYTSGTDHDFTVEFSSSLSKITCIVENTSVSIPGNISATIFIGGSATPITFTKL